MRDRFANGVAFVELAPIEDPDWSSPRSRISSESPSGATRISSARSRAGSPRASCCSILDNLEHLVDAGPTLVELLRRAPMLTILATSRRLMHLSGEHVFPLQPLPIDDAVRLLATRALARDPTLDPATLEAESGREICRRLDCLPLAVELAATQIPALGIENLRERLSTRVALLAEGPRDLPARQRTLRDTLTWSTDLLSPEERTQFARLGVFAGGCSARRGAGRIRRNRRIAGRSRRPQPASRLRRGRRDALRDARDGPRPRPRVARPVG